MRAASIDEAEARLPSTADRIARGQFLEDWIPSPLKYDFLIPSYRSAIGVHTGTRPERRRSEIAERDSAIEGHEVRSKRGWMWVDEVSLVIKKGSPIR